MGSPCGSELPDDLYMAAIPIRKENVRVGIVRLNRLSALRQLRGPARALP